jgi:hypothetical protein
VFVMGEQGDVLQCVAPSLASAQERRFRPSDQTACRSWLRCSALATYVLSALLELSMVDFFPSKCDLPHAWRDGVLMDSLPTRRR